MRIHISLMKNYKITQSITNRQDASLGLYFRDVSRRKLLTNEEEIELTKRVKEGDQRAKDKLIEANLRFVISIAKQYQGKGIPLVDLIQEGNLGMLEAATKFNPDRGFRFISYAVWWIRQAIIKALSEQCRIVRVPMNQLAYINKINKTTSKYEQEFGRQPSPDEIEEDTNIKSNKVYRTLSYNSKTISLESPFNESSTDCLLDVLPNDSVSTEEIINKSDIKNRIESILSRLSFRNRDVLRMSYGIGVSQMSNEEIANRFGIGVERVRQILNTTVKYIKDHYSKELKGLL